MNLDRRLNVVEQALAVAQAAERSVVPLPAPVAAYFAASNAVYSARCSDLACDEVDRLSVRGAQPPTPAFVLPARPVYEAVHDLVRLWRGERGDTPIPTTLVQYRILQSGWHRLSYAVAEQRYEREGQTGGHQCTDADRDLALTWMFPGDGHPTYRDSKMFAGGPNYPRPLVWQWWEFGTREPDVFAFHGFEAAELALLDFDSPLQLKRPLLPA